MIVSLSESERNLLLLAENYPNYSRLLRFFQHEQLTLKFLMPLLRAV